MSVERRKSDIPFPAMDPLSENPEVLLEGPTTGDSSAGMSRMSLRRRTEETHYSPLSSHSRLHSRRSISMHHPIPHNVPPPTGSTTRDSTSSTASPVESQDTASSSKLTSSDKLTALPELVGNISLNPATGVAARLARSSAFAMSSGQRSYRHSLDATSSLPSFVVAHTMEREKSHASPSREGSRPPNRLTPDNLSTPRQRLLSIESDRHSAPNAAGSRPVFNLDRVARASDSAVSSPRPRPKTFIGPSRDTDTPKSQALNSQSQSPPRSRASSPFRFLHQISSGFHRNHRSVAPEEPFKPINPYKTHISIPCCTSSNSADLETGRSSTTSQAFDCDDLVPVESVKSTFRDALRFLGDTLPRQLYLNILLRLPAMYFSRVARVFEEAEVSKPDILRMMNAGYGSSRLTNGPQPSQPMGASGHSSPVPPLPDNATTAQMRYPPTMNALGMVGQVAAAAAGSAIFTPLPCPDEWTPGTVSPTLIRFKHSWEEFIDSLLKEWKTLNVVSALLASAILTIFQVPDAADDPVTKTLALLSLVCALMSLSYGCMYIVRFGTMRSMFHASRWAEEAQKTKTSILWNAWVLLATPAVWMSWAMLLFISAILSFVWRTGSENDPADRPPLSAKLALIPRIIITVVLFIGLIYIFAIVRTLKKYGSHQGSAEALLRESGIRRQFEHSHPHSPAPGEPRPAHANVDVRYDDTGGRKNGLRNGGVSEPEQRGRALYRAASPVPRRREEPNASQEKMSDRDRTIHMKAHSSPARPLGLPFDSKPAQQPHIIVDRFEGLPLPY